jgi:hypothetical protein
MLVYGPSVVNLAILVSDQHEVKQLVYYCELGKCRLDNVNQKLYNCSHLICILTFSRIKLKL